MRISDWSSDVCSSDLNSALVLDVGLSTAMDDVAAAREIAEHVVGLGHRKIAIILGDRKSVVLGKSVSVRVDLGGRRTIKKKNTNYHTLNSSITPTILQHP